MAFKAEELTSKIFPASGTGVWMACPQDTLGKGKPCGDQTKKPCPQDTVRPNEPCPQDTQPPRKPPKRSGGLDAAALALLQAQLRDRLAQGSLAAGR